MRPASAAISSCRRGPTGAAGAWWPAGALAVRAACFASGVARFACRRCAAPAARLAAPRLLRRRGAVRRAAYWIAAAVGLPSAPPLRRPRGFAVRGSTTRPPVVVATVVVATRRPPPVRRALPRLGRRHAGAAPASRPPAADPDSDDHRSRRGARFPRAGARPRLGRTHSIPRATPASRSRRLRPRARTILIARCGRPTRGRGSARLLAAPRLGRALCRGVPRPGCWPPRAPPGAADRRRSSSDPVVRGVGDGVSTPRIVRGCDRGAPEQQSAPAAAIDVRDGGVLRKSRRRPTLPGGSPQVPSALAVFTSVFGMGTGVSPPQLPPETYVNSVSLRPSRELQSEHEHVEERSQALGRLVPVG